MSENVIEGTKLVKSAYPDNIVRRNLSVGFLHALGGKDNSYGAYDPSEYRMSAYGLYGERSGGTISWQPDGIFGPPIDYARGLGIGGEGRDLNLGTAANYNDSISGEDVKKEILPTVSWHRRTNLGSLFKGGPGQLGFDTNNPEQRAKSYVWKQMNNKKGGGWGPNDPPQVESFGYSSDYLKLIREKGRYSDNAEASKLMSSFIQASTMGTAQAVAFGEFKTDSAEEAALRLWPYIKDYVSMQDRFEDGELVKAGEVTANELQTAVNELLATGGEKRMTTYDIQPSMSIRDELEDRLREEGLDPEFEIQQYIEVTQQAQRISKGVQKNLDLSSAENVKKLKEHMEQQLDMAVTTAVRLGRARTYEEDSTFAGEATRRMEEVFDWRALNHTWIEPVKGGIGLYNVHVPAQLLGADDVVPSKVNITFLPFPVDLVGLVTGISDTAILERFMNTVGAGGLGAVFNFAGVDYGARFRSTLGMYRQGFQEGFAPVIYTRGVVMAEDELIDQVYNFVTAGAMAMFDTRAKAKHKGPFSAGFSNWASRAVSDIAKYGTRQADRLKSAAYSEWVENRLTMGVDEEGEPREYGEEGSSQVFKDRLQRGRQHTLYQPKPFAWLRSSGIQRRAQYKTTKGVPRGPIKKQ